MLGFPGAGMPSPTHVADYERNTARRNENVAESPQVVPLTKAKKLD
jgi:hypothetical protein